MSLGQAEILWRFRPGLVVVARFVKSSATSRVFLTVHPETQSKSVDQPNPSRGRYLGVLYFMFERHRDSGVIQLSSSNMRRILAGGIVRIAAIKHFQTSYRALAPALTPPSGLPAVGCSWWISIPWALRPTPSSRL